MAVYGSARERCRHGPFRDSLVGVTDLARSQQFYAESVGCTIKQDYPLFVRFNFGDGSSSLALYG